MDLSVIILTFNTKDITLSCLKSVDKYFPKVRTEVIVVDNASIDKTAELIKNTKFVNFSPYVIINDKNLGFAKGNNVAIKASRGKHVLLLNSDTLVTANAIDNLYENATELINAGVLGARLLNSDGSVQASVFRLPTVMKTIKQFIFGNHGILDKYAPEEDRVIEVEALVGAVFLITRKAISKVGLFDERYFMYFEDLDYCRKVQSSGLKVYYVPKSRIVHLHGMSGTRSTDNNQWKRLIPSSKIYHGLLKYYIIFLITWLGQK